MRMRMFIAIVYIALIDLCGCKITDTHLEPSPTLATYKGGRVFVGAHLPQDALPQFIELQEQIRAFDLSGSFETKERLHVTLKYIGDVCSDPKKINAINKALKRINFPTITAKIAKIFLLTNRQERPRLIWAELDSKGLSDLHAIIENTLSDFVRLNTRGFRAHVSLFRFNDNSSDEPLSQEIIEKINELDASIFGQFTFDEFQLFESPKDVTQPWGELGTFKLSP